MQRNSGVTIKTERTKAAERRILKDLVISTAALLAFSCASYFLKLLDVLAEWTHEPTFKHISPVLLVTIYAIWLIGIFLLRRIYDLKRTMAHGEAAEAELARATTMAGMGRAASGIAHDFNNIMMIIHGMLEICLKDEGKDDSWRAHLGDARDTAEKGIRLADRLSRLGRRQSGTVKKTNLNEVLMGLDKILTHIGGIEIAVSMTLCPEALTMECDHTQLEELFVNLTTNAAQAMPEGGRIDIETRRVTYGERKVCDALGLEAGDYAVLSVADTGSGIDPELKPHIFEPYFTGREQGTGLGLAMVYTIVKQMGGAIEVETEPGEGTTFTVSLPLDQG